MTSEATEGGRRRGTQREYAAHRGCSEAYVSRLKREGKLVFGVDGRVDFDATDALLLAASDPDKEGVRARWRRERGDSPAAQEAAAVSAPVQASALAAVGAAAAAATQPAESGRDDDAPIAGTGASSELYEARLRAQTRTAEADAQMKELDLLERAGVLVKAREVNERIYTYGREVRDLFLAIPARIQADLAAETDPQVIGRRLNEEIKATLHECSRRVAAEPRARSEALGHPAA